MSSEPLEPPPFQGPPAEVTTGRILVVDSSDIGREAIRRYLSRAGHEVVEAETIESAWTRLDGVDLAIIDVNLPDGSGLDFTTALRSDSGRTGLAILQTSLLSVGPREQAAGLDSGADAYLVLPVASPVLVSTVAALLRMRRAEQIARNHVAWMAERHARAEALSSLLADLHHQPDILAQAHRVGGALVPRFADRVEIELSAADGSFDHSIRIPDPNDPEGDQPVPPTGSSSRQLVVPLDLSVGLEGSITLEITDPSRSPLNDDDRAYLSELVQQAQIVLAATRLRQFEHDIAVRLQKALLPEQLHWHPNLEIQAGYKAAGPLLEVGGDWYDTLVWPTGHIGIVVGDVMGHNLESAATMGRLRAATAAIAQHVEPEPIALLTAIENYARGPGNTGFATVLCAIINPESGEMRYASAGHPPAVVVEQDGTAALLTEGRGTPLCSVIPPLRTAATIKLEPGALLVMYSDGLVERRRSSITDGIDHLVRFTVDLRNAPLPDLPDRLTDAMAALAPFEDDVVITCCRYRPPTARLHRSLLSDTALLADLWRDLRTWFTEQDVTATELEPILSAVSEIVNNSIEHGYAGRSDGEIDLELSNHVTYMVIRVVDAGGWVQRPPLPDRGRGMAIARRIATRFRCDGTVTGTTVTMTVPLSER